MTKPARLGDIALKVLMLIGLLGLILVPRPLTGWLDLEAARRFQAAGQFSQASVAYRSAAERLPWHRSLWEQAGLAALNAGQAADALSLLETAGRQAELSPAGRLALGDALWQAGDRASALGVWSSMRQEGLASADLFRRLVQAEGGDLPDLPRLITDWRGLLVFTPQDAQAHYQLGLLLAVEDPAGALPELVQAGRLDPGLAAEADTLRTAINTALLQPDLAYQSVVTGRALAAMGKWQLAEMAFQRAIQWDGSYADAWAWRGEALQHLGQDGGPDLQKAVALDPRSAMIQSLVGIYWQRQDKPDAALAAFQKAAGLEPDNAAWQVALGSAYEQSGDLVKALAYYQQAVTLDPQLAVAWQALAEYSLRNQADLDGIGLPAVTRLLELEPGDWQAVDLAGQLLLAADDPVGAEAVLKHALDLAPGQAAPALHLGLLYMQTGDRQAAYTYLSLAKSLDPDGPYGRQAGRVLEQYFP